MNLEAIEVGAFASNCYLLWNDAHEALVIDPGAEAERILERISGLALDVKAILLTHGHMDHVSALGPIYKAHPAPVGLHPLDAAWAFGPANQHPPYYYPVANPPAIDRSYADGQVWTDAGLTYRILETPGHSPGGVCFYFEDEGVLISGDTLFRGSVGRTDLPGSRHVDLLHSLERLKRLPDDTRVYPGHGPATTIGSEKSHNPFLLGL